MNRIKTYNSTGIAPDGRLFAGDLNLLQDLVAALIDYTQNLGAAQIAIGDSSLIISKFGTGEISVASALRTLGILRGSGGLISGTYTTTARDAIAAGSRPFGLVILNTTTGRYEWNAGSDVTPNWQPLGGQDYGTTLPTTGLFNGYRFTLFVQSSAVAWNLVYRADLDATYPWVMQGGDEMNGTTTITVPRLGYYKIEIGAQGVAFGGIPVVAIDLTAGGVALAARAGATAGGGQTAGGSLYDSDHTTSALTTAQVLTPTLTGTAPTRQYIRIRPRKIG